MFRFPSLLLLLITLVVQQRHLSAQDLLNDERFITYVADPRKQEIRMHWLDDNKKHFYNMHELRKWYTAHHKELLFAVNGGMFRPDFSPVGLYIEQKRILSKLEKKSGEGNFYLKPNGILYITDQQKAFICKSEDFVPDPHIVYATQSGPMLLFGGTIHPAFKQGSSNLNIRNGVGVLPDKRLVFVMSKKAINFYDFATYFRDLGCAYALYLDGNISKTFLPEKNWKQEDGQLGVIIAVSEK